MKYNILVLVAAILLTLPSCNDEDDTTISSNSRSRHNTSKDYTIYEFIHACSYYYYLWNSQVPTSSSASYYSNFDSPSQMFESFRDSKDRYSAVINNYTEVYNSLDNDYSTSGINYELYRADENSNDVIALVKYVYDDSPAAQAGIKRGDVIKQINGLTITSNNYSELLDNPTMTFGYTHVYIDQDNKICYDGELTTSASITKTNMTINPILIKKVIPSNGKRIGYLLYDSFTSSTDEILDAFEWFKAQEVDEFVLDLRLNGGGYVTTLDTLASLLVPSGNEDKVFISSTYNDYVTSMYKKEGLSADEYFTKQDNNLNLNNLYVLTSSSTASASEELISGLSAYMNVIKIGKTTYGKYTSCWLLNDDEDQGYDENGIAYSEWAIYLVIGSCVNANGEMNFENGFVPDYEIKDTYTTELGDENEPLLAKAIELINGGAIAKKSYQEPQGLLYNIPYSAKPKCLQEFITKR